MRLILHCNLHNFYASVECLQDPALKAVPLVVAGDPESRHGVVLAKNDVAKAAGVKTGDTVWEARQKIGSLVAVKPRFDLYMKFSKRAKEIYTRYTPLVEPFGADECWLDLMQRTTHNAQRTMADENWKEDEPTVRGGSTANGIANPSAVPHSSSLIPHSAFAYGKEVADEIRAAIKKELSLTASVGVSFNKVFAKLGSDLKKPDATTVISPANFKAVVWPLPVGELFMVGRKTAEKLYKCNIRTIGDLAAADGLILKEKFGVVGLKLKAAAAGLDDEPVREAVISHQNKSYGHGMTAKRDIAGLADLSALVYYLSDRVAARLRKDDVRGYGVAIDLRSNELRHVAKQCTLFDAVRSSAEIADAAMGLAKSLWDGNPPLRTVTVSVFHLIRGGYGQASMFDLSGKKKSDCLDLAVEKIRKKYGSTAILRADLVERDFIYDKTDDEDFLPFQR